MITVIDYKTDRLSDNQVGDDLIINNLITKLPGYLIYFGCFAATLSSAIASLVGAPRVLQVIEDRIYVSPESSRKYLILLLYLCIHLMKGRYRAVIIPESSCER